MYVRAVGKYGVAANLRLCDELTRVRKDEALQCLIDAFFLSSTCSIRLCR